MKPVKDKNPAHSFPLSECPRITMTHGGGGRSMRQLIDSMFAPLFESPDYESDHDGALLEVAGARLAFTTDSFVVDPIFFPGGSITMGA